MPCHGIQRRCVFFGFDEGGGRGGGVRAQVLSYFLHVAAIFRVQKCADEVWKKWKGDQCATSGKERETGLS